MRADPDVVVVVGMGRGAVDQCGLHRGGPLPTKADAGLARRACKAPQGVNHRLLAAEHDTGGDVGEAVADDRYRAIRNVLVAKLGREVAYCACQRNHRLNLVHRFIRAVTTTVWSQASTLPARRPRCILAPS